MKTKPAARKRDPKEPLSTKEGLRIIEGAVHFLRGAATYPAIRQELIASGYRHEDHAEGLRHLTTALAVPAGDSTWTAEPMTPLEEVRRFLRGRLRVAEAILSKRHPEEHARLFRKDAFAKLKPNEDYGPTLIAFLAGADALPPGSPALKTLAGLGITPEVRNKLAFHAPVTASFEQFGPMEQTPPLLALREWLALWSEVARDVLQSRESLIRLGLARRRLGHEPERPEREEPRAETRPTLR